VVSTSALQSLQTFPRREDLLEKRKQEIEPRISRMAQIKRMYFFALFATFAVNSCLVAAPPRWVYPRASAVHLFP
jgi:hypothetical protein